MTHNTEKRKYLYMVLILAVVSVPRFYLCFNQPAILWPDSISYLNWSVRIAQGDALSAYPIFRTPLYSIFLSLFFPNGLSQEGFNTLLIVQHLLGLCSVGFIFLLALEFMSLPFASLAALIFGLHGLQIYYEQVVLTEALFVPFFLAGLFFVARLRRVESSLAAFNAGLVLGLTALVRPVAQPLLLLAILLTLIFGRRVKVSVILVGGFMFAILPWLVANHRHEGYWGLSREVGINMFHRIVDIDRAPFPENPQDRQILRMTEDAREKHEVVYFYVRNALRRKGVRLLEADKRMFDFAIECLLASPGDYAIKTLDIWARYFTAARNSVFVCDRSGWPVFCSENTTLKLPDVERQIIALDPASAKQATTMVNQLNLPLSLFSLLALPGAALLIFLSKDKRDLRLLILGSVLLLSILTAVFNREEDRFRLPVDGLIIILLFDTASQLLSGFGRTKRVRRSWVEPV